MKRWMMGALVVLIFLGISRGVALSAERRRGASKQDNFNSAVNLKKFRTGNPDWDTQELVSSGLTALHQEHLRILEELDKLRAQISDIEDEL